MPAQFDFSSPSGPRTDRVPLRLPCSIRVHGQDTAGRVIDISLGGLGLSLGFEDAVEIDQGTEGTVDIEGIGQFEIECRWVKGNRVGAQFLDDVAASEKVQAYFDANGFAAE